MLEVNFAELFFMLSCRTTCCQLSGSVRAASAQRTRSASNACSHGSTRCVTQQTFLCCFLPSHYSSWVVALRRFRC